LKRGAGVFVDVVPRPRKGGTEVETPVTMDFVCGCRRRIDQLKQTQDQARDQNTGQADEASRVLSPITPQVLAKLRSCGNGTTPRRLGARF
jgi:hypothetical protein